MNLRYLGCAILKKRFPLQLYHIRKSSWIFSIGALALISFNRVELLRTVTSPLYANEISEENKFERVNGHTNSPIRILFNS